MDNPINLINHAFIELGALNIGKSPLGYWQVSTRDNKYDGWQIYQGPELGDVIYRACTKGPQLPKLVVPVARRRRRLSPFPWDAPR